MAYISDLEYLKNRIINDEIRCFRIHDSNQKTLLEECSDGSLTPADVAERVENTLSRCTGVVYVELAPMTKAERAEKGGMIKYVRIPFQCGAKPAAVQGIGSTGPAVGYHELLASQEQRFNDRLSAMEERFGMKREIDDLKRELAEAKQANPNVKYVLDNLGTITGILGIKMPVPIAGPGDVPVAVDNIQLSEEQAAEFAEKQLRRLLEVDPEFLDVLRRLADMAETNKPMYDMAKNMLPK